MLNHLLNLFTFTAEDGNLLLGCLVALGLLWLAMNFGRFFLKGN